MAALAEVWNQLTITDSGGVAVYHQNRVRFAPGVGTTGQRQTVSLTGSAFTSFSVPSGARLLVVVLPSTAASLNLKAVSGDTAIPITPASAGLGLDMWLPVSGLSSLGILNSGSTVSVEIIWV